MKLLIIADGSKKIGYGHLVRCITIAEYLLKKGWECSILDPGFEILKVKFLNTKALTIITKQSLVEIQNKKNENNKFDLTIIDGYNFNFQFKLSFYNISRKVMIIDDLAKNKNCCEIILDQSPGRKDLDYSKLVPSDCHVLTGSRYIIIRDELLTANKLFNFKRKRKRKRKRKILISLGSTDPDNISLKVLKFLFYLNFKIEISIIVTKNSINILEINKLLKLNKNKFNIFFNPTVKDLKKIYFDTDICIGSPGVAIWERIHFGIANIIFQPNVVQKHLSDYLKDKKIVKELNLRSNCFSLKSILKLKNLLYNDFLISKMVFKGNTIVDGKGLVRVCDVIEKVCEYEE